MKHLLLTTIATVLLVGCGESKPPEPPDISIYDAAGDGNIEAVKHHIAAGTDLDAKMQDAATKAVAELLIAKGADVNAKNENGGTPLLYATLMVTGKSMNDLRNTPWFNWMFFEVF